MKFYFDVSRQGGCYCSYPATMLLIVDPWEEVKFFSGFLFAPQTVKIFLLHIFFHFLCIVQHGVPHPIWKRTPINLGCCCAVYPVDLHWPGITERLKSNGHSVYFLGIQQQKEETVATTSYRVEVSSCMMTMLIYLHIGTRKQIY